MKIDIISKNPVIQRVIDLLNEKKISQSALGRLLNITPQGVGQLLRSANTPELKHLEKISETYSCSLNYLLKGDKDSLPIYAKPEIDKEFAGRGVKRLESQSVPLFDFEASAGLVKLFDSRPNVLDYIQIPNMPRCDGAVHITGDSMYPLLKSGDIVMYKIIPDIKTGIVYGNMYLLSAMIGGEEHTLVKYIQKSPEGNNYVRLGSQNSYHDPIDILRSDIKALAFVKASIRINSMS